MGLFVIAGEEVGFDEILFATLKRGKASGQNSFAWETTPAAGGAAGAVLVVNPWEEDKG
ncbi:hypothetical protein [Mesorhizobium sp. Cs1321R2N1]|uniref:hypothetical protein n=1 Tax=Mesorhizobium sp. Cs1321R2N1 TaxID=3015174 RepID=UPI00301CB572